MNIRDTQVEDADRVSALICAVARERKYLASTTGFGPDATRAYIAAVKEAGGVHLVAVEAGGIVGWCDIAPHPFEGMTHTGRLGMGLGPDHRARGIGRALLEAALQKAFAASIQRVELEVFASNTAAVRLYEQSGFKLEGRKVGARKLDGAVDDLLLFAKLK